MNKISWSKGFYTNKNKEILCFVAISLLLNMNTEVLLVQLNVKT